MIRKAFISLLFLAATITSKGQQMVDNSAYDLMLKMLLSHSVNEVSVEKAGSLKKVVFLDSREIKEFNTSHIKDSRWIGYEDFSIERLQNISKTDKIIVYCSVGARSEKIAEKLINAGYKDVSNLYGGIFEWVNSGRSVYSQETKTDTVHAYSRTWGIWLNKGVKVYD